jgi:hypothetical protein
MRQVGDYQQWIKFGSHVGQPGHRDGVQSNTEKLMGVPLLFVKEEFEVVIMIGHCRPKRCMGRTEFLT